MLKEMFDLRKVKACFCLPPSGRTDHLVLQEILTLTKPEMSIYDAAIDSFDPRMKVALLPIIIINNDNKINIINKNNSNSNSLIIVIVVVVIIISIMLPLILPFSSSTSCSLSPLLSLVLCSVALH